MSVLLIRDCLTFKAFKGAILKLGFALEILLGCYYSVRWLLCLFFPSNEPLRNLLDSWEPFWGPSEVYTETNGK